MSKMSKCRDSQCLNINCEDACTQLTKAEQKDTPNLQLLTCEEASLFSRVCTIRREKLGNQGRAKEEQWWQLQAMNHMTTVGQKPPLKTTDEVSNLTEDLEGFRQKGEGWSVKTWHRVGRERIVNSKRFLSKQWSKLHFKSASHESKVSQAPSPHCISQLHHSLGSEHVTFTWHCTHHPTTQH